MVIRIDVNQLKKHAILIKENHRIGTSFSKIFLYWHPRSEEFQVIARQYQRQIPPGTPSHIRHIVMKNPGYMRQVTSSDFSGHQIMYSAKDLDRVIDWVNREFGLLVEATEKLTNH
jgi:hypothetical protein